MSGMISRALGFSKPQTQESFPKEGNPDDELRVVAFKPCAKGVVSGTPFGAKIEVALRLAGLPYKMWQGNSQDTKTAPKTKLPALHHGPNVVPDSKAIFEYLRKTYPQQMAIFSPDRNSSLKCNEAIAMMAQRMLEEHTYFCVMYIGWQRDDNWAKLCPLILDGIPAPIRGPMSMIIRSAVLRDLHGQGVGRHSLEEVEALLEQDLQACEELLAAIGVYLAGSNPCQADCFLFAILDMGLNAENIYGPDQAFTNMVRTRPALMAFYKRLRDKLFPNGVSDNWQPGMFNPAA